MYRNPTFILLLKAETVAEILEFHTYSDVADHSIAERV